MSEQLNIQQDGGAALLDFSQDTSHASEFGQSGSSITTDTIENSLRSIFDQAREQFRADIDGARDSLNSDRSEREQFRGLREQARTEFEDARQQFDGIKQSARERFRLGAFSNDDLNDLIGQTQSLFSETRNDVLKIFTPQEDSNIPPQDDSGQSGAGDPGQDFNHGDPQDSGESDSSGSEDEPPSNEDSSGGFEPPQDEQTQPVESGGGDVADEPQDNSPAAPVDDPTRINPDQLDGQKGLVNRLTDLKGFLGQDGDVLDPGGGTNVVAGAGGSDVIFGNRSGAFNTIATGKDDDGTGDLIILGPDSTNRIFDFSTSDRLGLIEGEISFDDIVIGQGSNRDNGGLNQPLDSFRNTVVLGEGGKILASLVFTDANSITSDNFVVVNRDEAESLLTPQSSNSENQG